MTIAVELDPAAEGLARNEAMRPLAWHGHRERAGRDAEQAAGRPAGLLVGPRLLQESGDRVDLERERIREIESLAPVELPRQIEKRHGSDATDLEAAPGPATSP